MMRRNLQHRTPRHPRLFLVTVLFLSTHLGYSTEDPQLFKVHLTGGYLEVDSRYDEQERVSTQTGTVSYNNTRLDIRPKVHLDFDGSVYHPNLMDYDLSVDLGQSIEYERLITPNSEQKRSDKNPLQFYNGQILILKDKLISGSVFGNYNLVRLDNGFFSKRLLYQTGYGARLNYSGEVLPWSVTISHKEDEETDTRTPRNSMQDEVKFRGSVSRGDRGKTSFEYLFHEFSRQDYNVPLYTGVRNSFRLNDSTFSPNRNLHLRSHLYYNHIDSTAIPSRTFTLREFLTAQHTSDLKSTYEYSYDSRDSGSTKRINHTGRVSLHHQLYDSLSSTVSSDFRDVSDTSIDTFRSGFTLEESYTKRIGDSSILNLGATLSQHSEERRSKGGDISQINSEPLTLTTGNITLLNQPNVIASSIEVMDPTGTILYSEFIDYMVIPRGSVTEIQRVVTGSIPNGGAVLISYRIINQGSGSFTTRQNYYRFRYTMFNRLLSFYGHLRTVENDGAVQFVMEDLVETVYGLESNWNGFNVGAEYQNYDSSLFPTETLRFFQHANFPLSWRSILSLSADQSLVSYPDTDEEIRRFYQNIAYRNQLTHNLSFEIDGGYHIERGQNDSTLNRDLLAVNTELNYLVGKTSFRLSYEYLHDNYLNETRERNTVYLSVRRNF